MTRFQILVVAAALGSALASCKDEKAESARSATVDRSSALAPGEVAITGQLAISETEGAAALVANRKVDLLGTDGEIIATTRSDADGGFTLPGALALDTGVAAGLVSAQYTIESIVEDNGAGKVLATKKPVTIDSSAVKNGVFEAGEQRLSEVAAIRGQVTFVNTDDKENKSIPKLGIEVFIPGLSFFAKTDADGRFLILYVPAGKHDLRIEKGPYARTMSVTLQEGKTLDLGVITVSADSIPSLTMASRNSTDFKHPMCVSLSTTEKAAKIYYTTDGANPVVSESLLYDPDNLGACTSNESCPICVQDKTTVVKFFAVDAAGNIESIKSEVYIYNKAWADPDDETDPAADFFTEMEYWNTYNEITRYVGYHAFPLTLSMSDKDETTGVWEDGGGRILYSRCDQDDDDCQAEEPAMEYTGSLQIDDSTMVTFFAEDHAGRRSALTKLRLDIYKWHLITLDVDPTGGSNPAYHNFATDRADAMFHDDKEVGVIVSRSAGTNCNGTNANTRVFTYTNGELTLETPAAIPDMYDIPAGVIKSKAVTLLYTPDSPAFSQGIHLVGWSTGAAGGKTTVFSMDEDDYSVWNSYNLGATTSACDGTDNTPSPGGPTGFFTDYAQFGAAVDLANGKLLAYMNSSNVPNYMHFWELELNGVAGTGTMVASALDATQISSSFGHLTPYQYYDVDTDTDIEKLVGFGNSNSGSSMLGGHTVAITPETGSYDVEDLLTLHVPACQQSIYYYGLGGLVCFSGDFNDASTWLYYDYTYTDSNGDPVAYKDWSPMDMAESPSARTDALIFYDWTTSELVLLGGKDRYGNIKRDLWVLRK